MVELRWLVQLGSGLSPLPRLVPVAGDFRLYAASLVLVGIYVKQS